MTTMVHCDAVFEILTQGPFPSGGKNDHEVEAHLRVCHDCRDLAEALRPAVGLFHESLVKHQSLPRFDISLSSELARQSRSLPARPRMAPLVVMSIASGLLAWLCLANLIQEGNPKSPESAALAIAPDAAGWQTLTDLRLPLSCLPQPRSSAQQRLSSDLAIVSVSSHSKNFEFLCCAHCHHPLGTGPASPRAVQALQTACVSCHRLAADFSDRRDTEDFTSGRNLARI